MTILLSGFPPVVAPQTRLLILGSMPGVESLRQQQYYAHPRNAFWFIMGKLFGAHAALDYKERKGILIQQQISLWDVLAHCVRPGSLDSDIRPESEAVNQLDVFCRNQPELRAVAFNGRRARETFNRHFFKKSPEPWQNLLLIDLPSTSPAHAALRPNQKLAAWQQCLKPVLQPVRSK